MRRNALYQFGGSGRISRRTKFAYTLFIIDSTQRSQQPRPHKHHSNDFTADDCHRLPLPTRCQSFHQTMGQLLTFPLVSCVNWLLPPPLIGVLLVVVGICCCYQLFVLVVICCQSSLDSFPPQFLPPPAVGICCCPELFVILLIVVCS